MAEVMRTPAGWPSLISNPVLAAESETDGLPSSSLLLRRTVSAPAPAISRPLPSSPTSVEDNSIVSGAIAGAAEQKLAMKAEPEAEIDAEPETEGDPDDSPCKEETKLVPCDLCCEEFSSEDLQKSFCTRNCQSRASYLVHGVCTVCIERYVDVEAERVPHGLLLRLKCPICFVQTPLRHFSSKPVANLRHKLISRLFAATSVRCYGCENRSGVLRPFQTASYDETASETSLQEMITTNRERISSTMAKKSKLQSFHTCYRRYMNCRTSPAELYQALKEAVKVEVDVEFIESFAIAMGDPERIAVFLHWYYRRWPKMFTFCCKRPVCYSCQASSHHDGQTCSEFTQDLDRQNAQSYGVEAEDLVLHCPECGVAFVKGDGCGSLECFCGAYINYGGLLAEAKEKRMKKQLESLSSHVKAQLKLWSRQARHRVFFSRTLPILLSQYQLRLLTKRALKVLEDRTCSIGQAFDRYKGYLRWRISYRQTVVVGVPRAAKRMESARAIKRWVERKGKSNRICLALHERLQEARKRLNVEKYRSCAREVARLSIRRELFRMGNCVELGMEESAVMGFFSLCDAFSDLWGPESS